MDSIPLSVLISLLIAGLVGVSFVRSFFVVQRTRKEDNAASKADGEVVEVKTLLPNPELRIKIEFQSISGETVSFSHLTERKYEVGQKVVVLYDSRDLTAWILESDITSPIAERIPDFVALVVGIGLLCYVLYQLAVRLFPALR